MSLPTFHANTHQGDAKPSFWTSLIPSFALASSSGDHIGMVAQGGYGPSASTIDTQTDLLWGAPGTAKQAGPNQLFARPFATTPFLGMGSIDSIPDENKVKFGHSTANRKSIQTITDKQFPVFQPLIAEKEADIAENHYFVEPFLRGGMSSRLIPKVRVDLTK